MNQETKEGQRTVDGQEGASIRDERFPNLDKYRHHLECFDLSETQKIELLRAIWQIMQNFVDRAFGDDAAQCALGDVERIATRDAIADGPVIELAAEKAPTTKDNMSASFRRHAKTCGEGSDCS